MHRWKVLTSALLVVGAFGIAGCTRGDNPVDAPASAPTSLLTVTTVSDVTTINHYVVAFLGRTFDGTKTTFSYHVTGTGVEPALSHFTLELPPCAPALLAYDPTGSANINTNQDSGIYGIEWHLEVEADDSAGRTYSITFPGDVPPGIIRAQVKSGTEWGVAAVPGPCAGYHVTGVVYEDADKNSLFTSEESGIVNVTVALTDAFGSRTTATTPADGTFDFLVPNGTYTVEVASVTGEIDFNESLYESFSANTATSRTVTVGPDAPGVDFGFVPQSQKLIGDLESGLLLTTGRPVKFWKDQLRVAITGKGQSRYDRATMLAFLAQIEGLFIPEPFQFTDGRELEEALAVLNATGRDDLTALKKELLACEFNTVAGRGIVGLYDVQLVLVAWGESLVADASAVLTSEPTVTQSDGQLSVDPYATTSRLPSDGTVLLGLVNGSTGGGGGDE